MALRLTLKPHERVLIGNGEIRNGDARVELLVENKVPVLRESDILNPGPSRTPCQSLYLALQSLYVEPHRADEHRAELDSRITEVRRVFPGSTILIEKLKELVAAGRLYQAIKTARGLLEYEKQRSGAMP
jgi:flagellar protein FlbT